MKENENKREKKFSKKKVMVVTGMALLLALVGYAGGSTYARYLTSQNVPTQTATVANWGFVVSANASNLFSHAHNNGTQVTVSSGATTVDVQSSSENLVAPGTSGQLSFSINGTAEVLSELDVTLNGQEIHLTKTDGNVVYSPVKWTLKKDSNVVDNLQDKSLKEIANYLDEKFDKRIAANESFALNGNYTLSWAWALEDNTSHTIIVDDVQTTCNSDTVLGYLAAGKTIDGYTSELTAKLSLNIEVKQVQTNEATSFTTTDLN